MNASLSARPWSAIWLLLDAGSSCFLSVDDLPIFLVVRWRLSHICVADADVEIAYDGHRDAVTVTDLLGNLQQHFRCVFDVDRR